VTTISHVLLCHVRVIVRHVGVTLLTPPREGFTKMAGFSHKVTGVPDNGPGDCPPPCPFSLPMPSYYPYHSCLLLPPDAQYYPFDVTEWSSPNSLLHLSWIFFPDHFTGVDSLTEYEPQTPLLFLHGQDAKEECFLYPVTKWTLLSPTRVRNHRSYENVRVPNPTGVS